MLDKTAESDAEINIEDDGTLHIYASKQEGSGRPPRFRKTKWPKF